MTPENIADNLKDAVDTASDLLVVNRDQKNTVAVLAGMTEEERAPIKNFIQKVNLSAAVSKQSYGLIREKATQRNAGRPARTRKAKTAPGADTPKK